MFLIFLALGFNNAHPGMLGDSGAEYPMTGWETAPIGAVKNQEQATWRDDVSKVPVELYDSDEFLSFAPSVPANSGHTMASEFEENIVSGNVYWEFFELFSGLNQLSQSDRAAIVKWRAELTETVNSGSRANVTYDGIKLAEPIPTFVWLLVCGVIGLVAFRRKFKS